MSVLLSRLCHLAVTDSASPNRKRKEQPSPARSLMSPTSTLAASGGATCSSTFGATSGSGGALSAAASAPCTFLPGVLVSVVAPAGSGLGVAGTACGGPAAAATAGTGSCAPPLATVGALSALAVMCPLRVLSERVWQDLLVPRPSALHPLRDWSVIAHMSVDEVAFLVKVEDHHAEQVLVGRVCVCAWAGERAARDVRTPTITASTIHQCTLNPTTPLTAVCFQVDGFATGTPPLALHLPVASASVGPCALRAGVAGQSHHHHDGDALLGLACDGTGHV
jgi:hypothetical protein